jgi:hypothetical protein
MAVKKKTKKSTKTKVNKKSKVNSKIKNSESKINSNANLKIKIENIIDNKSIINNLDKTSENNYKKFILPLLLVVVLIVIGYVAFFQNNYTFEIESNGIMYYSNDYTPLTFFQDFKQNQTVYVSPIASENGMSNLTVNAMNLWLVVLAGNKINPVQLIRMENDGELIQCYTNDGNVNVSRELTVDECKAILNNPENAKVLINFGENNEVFLEKNKIIINSEKVEVVSQVNLFVLKKGFSNAEEIIYNVNTGISNIG